MHVCMCPQPFLFSLPSLARGQLVEVARCVTAVSVSDLPAGEGQLLHVAHSS